MSAPTRKQRERQERIEAARSRIQDYLYDRLVNLVPIRDLAKRAKIIERDMAALLVEAGYDSTQARQHDRLSLTKPYGDKRNLPQQKRKRVPPDMDAMISEANRAD